MGCNSKDFRKNKQKSYRIGYAYSENLLDWFRDDSLVGIDISQDGWDSEMISFPHLFELENKTYMIYLGNEFGRQGFGIAEMVSEKL